MKKLLLMLMLLIFVPLCVSSTFAQYEPSTQMGLPDGAIARFGKGSFYGMEYSPDVTQLAVTTSIGVWIYDAQTGEELDLITGGHEGRVYAAAFSPDSKHIATVGKDKTVRLWEVHTGQLLKTLFGHKDEVLSVAYSPDGQTIASGGLDNTIRLWNANTGKHIKTLKGHNRTVLSVIFSPDSETIVSSSSDDTIRFWDVAKGELINIVLGYRPLISYSPDGKTLLVVEDIDSSNTEIFPIVKLDTIYTMHMLNVITGERVNTISSLNYVNCFSYSPDGKTIAISDGERFGLWDATTGKHLTTLFQDEHELNTVAYSPDRKTIATVWGNKIEWWNAQTGENIKTLPSSKDNFYWGSISFSPDGKTIAMLGSRTIDLCNAESEKYLTTITGHKRSISGFAFSPDSKTIATGSQDGTARLWDTNTGENIHIIDMPTDHPFEPVSVDPPKFSPDGKSLAIRSKDKTLLLWDMQLEYIKRTIPGEHYHTSGFVFSHNGKILATMSKTEAVHLWSTETGEHINTLTGLVHFITFSPDGNILATSLDNWVELWSTNTGENLSKLFIPNACNTKILWTADGNPFTITIHQNESVSLWDLTTGQHIQVFEGDMNEAFASLGRSFTRMINKEILVNWNTQIIVSPTQDTFATAVKDNPVRLWDITTRKQIGKSINPLKGEKSYTLVQYSPDGKTIATIPVGANQQGGTVRLWDVATGELLKTLKGHSNCDYNSVAYFPDSKTIITGHRDGTMLLWDIPTR